MKDLLGHTGAVFSPCRRYRYRLWRVWDESLPRAVFCLMNPSDANEIDNDPTVERQQRRVMRWAKNNFLKVGGIDVVNAFSYVETFSHRLPGLHQSGFDLIGPENDTAILDAAREAAIFVCGWGKPGSLGGRDAAILRMLHANRIKPYALQVNSDGTPQHPLYLGYDLIPEPYEPFPLSALA